MANLAVLGSFKVNGVAELHSQLVQTTILKDFVDFYGVEKFGNITNGITPRRWLDQCNPGLSALITESLGGDKNAWLKDLTLLKGLVKFEDDTKFQAKWESVKQQNKERLAREFILPVSEIFLSQTGRTDYIETTLGVKVNTKVCDADLGCIRIPTVNIMIEFIYRACSTSKSSVYTSTSVKP